MTGEITLRGRVLPIGGLKSKILAAHLAGAKIVILPRKNEKDLRDIPEEIRKSMKLVLVDSMDQVLEAALRRKPKALVVDEPPKIVKPATSHRSSPSARSRVRRTHFPPTDQPPVVVDAPTGRRPATWPVDGRPDRVEEPSQWIPGLLRGPRRAEDRVTGRHQEGLPQARPRAPSRHQARRQGRRAALQGGQRGQRGPVRPRQAQEVRPPRRGLGGLRAGRRRSGRGGRVRSPAARSRGFAGPAARGPAGRRRRPLRVPHDRRDAGDFSRLLPGVLRRRGADRRRRRPARPRSRRPTGGAVVRGHPRRDGPRRRRGGRVGARGARRRATPDRRRPATAEAIAEIDARGGLPRHDPAGRDRRASGSRSRSRAARTTARGSG